MARVAASRVKRAKLLGASLTLKATGILPKGTVVTPDHKAWDEILEKKYGFEDDKSSVSRNEPFLVLEAEPTAAQKRAAKKTKKDSE